VTTPLLKVDSLTKEFVVEQSLFGKPLQTLRAVDDVSLELHPGETLGIVGESGCGKTTLGRLILRLLDPTSGRIHFKGQDITDLSRSEVREIRRYLQVVFQDPYSSLNPRLRVVDIIGEPLTNFGFSNSQAKKRVAEVMEVVGLLPEWMARFPHAFSGGQRQRIGIARALSIEPNLIVCDEAVSALDVSIQAQILNLFQEIQKKLQLSLIFITHNLGVVRHVSDRIAVMYLGQVVELASENDLFTQPQHPYTKALISAVPEPDPASKSQRITLEGEIPSPVNPPSGCYFHTRCPRSSELCRKKRPKMEEVLPSRWVRCHFPETGLRS
jgi:oligopeptide transport system ATP-binding protein